MMFIYVNSYLTVNITSLITVNRNNCEPYIIICINVYCTLIECKNNSFIYKIKIAFIEIHWKIRNQILSIKHCLQDSRKKYNTQGDIGALLGKNCEMKKIMRFLKETEMFYEI